MTRASSRTPPYTLVTRKTRELRRGEAIFVRGLGTIPIIGVMPLPRGQALIALARDDLAVISNPDAPWEALTPTKVFRAPVTWCAACRSVGRFCRVS